MKIINHIFRVIYHTKDSFDKEGEFLPDKFKTKDFKVFTQAVKFAQVNCDLCGAAGINQIDIDFSQGYEVEIETNNRWECTQTECYIVQGKQINANNI